MRVMGFNVFKQIARRLLTKTESLDDGTVAIDIAVVQVVEQSATLADELGKRTGSDEVLVVLLHVLREVLDAVGEEGNLALCGTCILSLLVVTVLCENLLLLSLV